MQPSCIEGVVVYEKWTLHWTVWGITGAVKEFSQYPSDCKSVYAMFISNRTFVILYDKGIAKIDMAKENRPFYCQMAVPRVMKYEALHLSGIRERLSLQTGEAGR